MRIFRSRPSEHELELIVLRAATLCRAQEIDSKSVASMAHVSHWVNFAIEERKLKNDNNSVRMAAASVQALLTERTFLTELMEYQFKNSGRPLPDEFRTKMLAAIQKMVSEFMTQR